MFTSIDRHSHHLRSSLVGGMVVALDRLQNTLGLLRKELRSYQYRVDPRQRGSAELFKLGPADMTPARAAILDGALARAKERSASPS